MRGLLKYYQVFKLWILVSSYTNAGTTSPSYFTDVNLGLNTTLNSTAVLPNDENENFTATLVTNFTEDTKLFSDNTLPNFYNISVSGTSQTCVSYQLPKDQNCLEANEFDNVTLWCNVSDTQEQSVTWFIEDNENSDTSIGILGSALRIYNISEDCGFKYKCKVDFIDNTTITYTINVIVKYPPYIFLKSVQQSDYPPTTPLYDAVSIVRGNVVDIVCVIAAMPKPYYVEWKVNNQEYYKYENNKGKSFRRKDENYYTFGNDSSGLVYTVKVKVVEDNQYGTYTCSANNTVGYDEWNFIVKETSDVNVNDDAEASGNGSNDDDDNEY